MNQVERVNVRQGYECLSNEALDDDNGKLEVLFVESNPELLETAPMKWEHEAHMSAVRALRSNDVDRDRAMRVYTV